MPRRFNKSEIDEWRSLSKKDKDDEDIHEDEDEKGASVLDALESKIARPYVTPEGLIAPGGPNDPHEVECPTCGARHSVQPPDFGARRPTDYENDNTPANQWANSWTAGILEEPALHTPEHIVQPSAEPSKTPCTHCGAPLAPFVVEHRLNCPHCGNQQEPIRWEGVMGSHTAAPIFPDQQFAPPTEQTHPNAIEQGWGAVQPCRNCGHGMQTFPGQRGAMCPNCGHEEAIMAQGKVAEVSMPPEGTVPQKETALPYNPGAYEGEVEAMHPAAQYTYQRAVAQGAAPQAAMAAAQEKQGEMMKRTQEGQNTQGVQIPVISRIGAEEEKCKDCGKPMNPVEAMVSSTHGVCGDCTKRKQKEVTGFVSVATIKRVSHLI